MKMTIQQFMKVSHMLLTLLCKESAIPKKFKKRLVKVLLFNLFQKFDFNTKKKSKSKKNISKRLKLDKEKKKVKVKAKPQNFNRMQITCFFNCISQKEYNNREANDYKVL